MALPRLRWIVGDGDPRLLSELLDKLCERAALEAGRVFVAGRRASAGELDLELGSAVEIFAVPAAAPLSSIELLHVADGLVWVDKPAGIPTEPDQRGFSHSVVAQVAERLGTLPQALHALSRLDVAVSGVVVLSTSTEARQRVNELRARAAIRRRYVGIASAAAAIGAGVWKDAIGRAGKGVRRGIGGAGAQRAETRYAGVARTALGAALLAFEPVTGRTHQIRVHAGAHGAPLYGDRLYGGPARVTDAMGRVRELGRIALHAAWTSLPASGGTELRVASETAPELVSLWGELGGRAEDFELALADSVFVE